MKLDYSFDCDVIIVNYNAGDLLIDCVNSVLSESAKAIVVDNASRDSSIQSLRQNFINDDRVKIICNDKNLGFAAACNIGAQASISPYLLFLNPDSVLESGALQRMVDVLDSSPSIGMVGGFLRNPDGSEQPGGRRDFPSPGKAFLRAFGLSKLSKLMPSVFTDFQMTDAPIPTQAVPVPAISGACMLVKRQAVDDVGLWDDAYFLHCEDLDWCMRFQQKGWQIYFVPDAPVTHEWGACSSSRPYFVEWHKHHGMVRFYKKFYKDKYPFGMFGLVTMGVWLRFAMVSLINTLKILKTKIG